MRPLVPRIAKESDLSFINHCILACFDPYRPIIGRTPHSLETDFRTLVKRNEVYVFERSQISVGMVVLIPKKDHLYLGNMGVLPKYRGRGFGGEILNHSESIALRLGFTCIQLYTHQKLSNLHQLYQSFGYNETQRKSDVVFFRKKFKSRGIRESERELSLVQTNKPIVKRTKTI